MRKTTRQQGAVSLFVVIFAALLITVVTVSFIRIMIQNQQQSTANDLSQSAYDSAQAGVEDGKRAILRLQIVCDPINPDYNLIDCNKAKEPTCNAALGLLSDVNDNMSPDGSEVKVQTSGSGNLNQAYTCVTIVTDTPYVEGNLTTDASKIIPLIGTLSFEKIKIEWYNNSSASKPAGGSPLLSMKSNWPVNQAPILRAQLIEFGSTFKLSDFDNTSITNNGYNNTLFLYPSDSKEPNSFSDNSHPTAGLDGRPGMPSKVICNTISPGGTSCSVELLLPEPINNGDNVAYLNLKSLYKGTYYKVSLLDNTGATVPFKNVQPLIDSTGRANDLFRRVRTRVEYPSDFPYPLGEVNITGNLCKTFSVTDPSKDPDALAHYKPGSCNP